MRIDTDFLVSSWQGSPGTASVTLSISNSKQIHLKSSACSWQHYLMNNASTVQAAQRPQLLSVQSGDGWWSGMGFWPYLTGHKISSLLKFVTATGSSDHGTHYDFPSSFNRSRQSNVILLGEEDMEQHMTRFISISTITTRLSDQNRDQTGSASKRYRLIRCVHGYKLLVTPSN